MWEPFLYWKSFKFFFDKDCSQLLYTIYQNSLCYTLYSLCTFYFHIHFQTSDSHCKLFTQLHFSLKYKLYMLLNNEDKRQTWYNLNLKCNTVPVFQMLLLTKRVVNKFFFIEIKPSRCVEDKLMHWFVRKRWQKTLCCILLCFTNASHWGWDRSALIYDKECGFPCF